MGISAFSDTQIVNNTVFQPTGDAVRVEVGYRNVVLRNNILWAQAGYDIFVPGESQAGFQSPSAPLGQSERSS